MALVHSSLIGTDLLKNLLLKFPTQVTYAFAYGSAVFAQKNQKIGKVRSPLPVSLQYLAEN
jgi:hypothetical protein